MYKMSSKLSRLMTYVRLMMNTTLRDLQVCVCVRMLMCIRARGHLRIRCRYAFAHTVMCTSEYAARACRYAFAHAVMCTSENAARLQSESLREFADYIVASCSRGGVGGAGVPKPLFRGPPPPPPPPPAPQRRRHAVWGRVPRARACRWRSSSQRRLRC